MKTPKYFYKVVWAKLKLNFTSAIVSSPMEVEYKINEWTIPNEGQNQFLFVFGNRSEARLFKKENFSNGYGKIFKCEVKNQNQQRTKLNDYTFDFEKTSVWLVDAVKLTKKVY